MPRKRLENLDYKTLVLKLDKEVGFYIKKTFELAPGISRCYTCKNLHETKDIQWGHFISRRYYAVRWDLRNSRPQCRGCNGPRGGESFKFRGYLVEDIGEENVKDLENLARMNGERNTPREVLIEQVKLFKAMNKKFKE
jgi:hypothetical protein